MCIPAEKDDGAPQGMSDCKRVSDCYGLVKGYLWTEGGGEPKYSTVQDRNQEMAYLAAKDKGKLANMPDIPGLVPWMKGHAGIYIGGGEFIECVGCPVGTRKGTIKNGAVTSGSRFTHWFKDTYITYPDASTVDAPAGNAEVQIGTVKLNIDGKAVSAPGVMIGGSNYVGARAVLEAIGYTVSWEGGVVVARKS